MVSATGSVRVTGFRVSSGLRIRPGDPVDPEKSDPFDPNDPVTRRPDPTLPQWEVLGPGLYRGTGSGKLICDRMEARVKMNRQILI